MANLQLKNMKKVYPRGSTHKQPEKKANLQITDEGVVAVQDFNLDIADKEFIVLVGPSGCGKTTTLRMVAGLEEITAGELYIDGKLMNHEEPKNRDISMVFQSYALYPHMTVWENIGFPLKLRKVDKQAIRKRVEEVAEILDITEYLDRKPKELSGGQKQRVAIARALAANPKILLCDEATSALDPRTTQSILQLLKDINKKYGITIVIITHEMSVVREICSHVAIIGEGHLVEQGRVSDIFAHPKTAEAKELILKGSGTDRRTLEDRQKELMKGKCCVRIVFSVNSSFEPVIANMVLKFGQPINILRADTKNVEGIARGEMILSLPDDRKVQEEMKAYLAERGLAVEEVNGYVD